MLPPMLEIAVQIRTRPHLVAQPSKKRLVLRVRMKTQQVTEVSLGQGLGPQTFGAKHADRIRAMRRLLIALLLVAPACAPRTAPPPTVMPVGGLLPTAAQLQSERGVVSAATKEAAEAGAMILARGGNAVDAAVATGFALAVTEPSMSGLGGRASAIVRQPDGTLMGVDGLNQVPAGYKEKSGLPEVYERIAVPGVPATLAYLLERHGTLPLSTVLEPAIRLADEGFILNDGEAARWAAAQKELSTYGAGRGTYLKPDGSLWTSGERVRSPMLAATLRRLAAEGVDAFYRGSIAEEIVADMVANKAFVSRDDLAGYRALPAIPVRGTYRGHSIASNFRPAAGHAVIQALHTLERVQVPGPGDDVRWASVVGQAMHWALTDRSMRRGTEHDTAAFLTSAEHAAERASRIVMPPPVRASTAAAEPWQPGGLLFPPGTLVTAETDREATSHFSVADAEGRVVALTQSLGPAMGTRLVAPGLGFMYATRLGTTPGSRPMSTIAPTIVGGVGGVGVVALGGAGDSRIISAVIQVISRMVDHKMSPTEAMRAPRVHPDAEKKLRIEDGPVGAWSPEDRKWLSEWGFALEPSPSGFFGRVHAVATSGAGQPALGVAEPRWTGGVSGPTPLPRGVR